MSVEKASENKCIPQPTCSTLPVPLADTDTMTDVLVLPSLYIPRSLKQLSPLSFPPDPNMEFTMKESDIFLQSPSPSQKPLVVIYALPGYGATSLLISLIVQIQEKYPARWVSYMNLRKASALIPKNSRDEWCLPKLICAYSQITDSDSIQHIQNFFQTNSKQQDHDTSHHPLAELFLDGLDDIPKAMIVRMLDILSETEWSKCSVRVWLTCRTHLKSMVRTALGEIAAYDLLPFSREQQASFFYLYWKRGSCGHVPDHKLKQFVYGLLLELEKMIPDFDKCIASSPLHCIILRDFFPNVAERLMGLKCEVEMVLLNFSITKLFEKFVHEKLESYITKLIMSESKANLLLESSHDKECRRLSRIHCKIAIRGYPTFSLESQQVFGNQDLECEEELYRIGIVYEDNGRIQFLHKMYAEFLLAQYFVDCSRLKNSSLLYVNFFLNFCLFDEELKRTRQFFDAYFTIQQKRNKVKGSITWNRLRQFLIQHYFLECKQDGSREDADVEKYERVKNNGTVLHLAIMERNFKLVTIILDCFRSCKPELKLLLRMRVSFQIFSENPFTPIPTHSRDEESCIVDTFQLFALFSRGEETGKVVHNFYLTFGEDEMAGYVTNGNKSVVHYAAMNSNHAFLDALLPGRTRELNVNVRNDKGEMPIHVVLAGQWFYAMKIVDHEHPQLFTKGGLPQFTAQPPGGDVTKVWDLVELGGACLSEGHRTGNKEIWCFEGIQKNFHGWDDYAGDPQFNPLRPHLFTLKRLVKYGGDVNGQQASDGKGVLHQAATLESVKILKWLVTHGANVNLTDKWKRTPAHYAALRGHEEMHNILMDSGTAAELKDAYGFNVKSLRKNSFAAGKICIIC